MALAAQSMYDSFKGVPYDETPLVESEARFKALLAQYPDEARKCRAADMVREIVAIRGERAYETAKFYERTGKPQSAIFYYRQVAEEFPSTVWASEARTKVGVAPRRPAAKPAAEEPKPAATEAKPAAEEKPAPPGMTEVKFGQGKPAIEEAKPAPAEGKVTATKPKPAPPEERPAPPGMTEVKFGQDKPAVEEIKPASPAVQPATQPAAQDKPAPAAPTAPVDLEKLGNPSENPSSKGQSK
jgi:hypothetical protein